jgi:hypothetical protein
VSDGRPSKDWFSRSEICSFHGITEQTFDRTYRPLIPETAIQKVGARAWYLGSAYFEAVIEYKLRVATKREQREAGDSEMGGELGFDSQAAGRIQRAKADQEEYKRDVMRGRLVDKDKFKGAMMELTPILRRGIETLERLKGQEASAIMNGCVDEWTEGLGRYFDEK